MEVYTNSSSSGGTRPGRKSASKSKKSARKIKSKAEYEGLMETNLKDLGAKIDEFAAKVNSATCNSSKDLRDKKEKASERLCEIKTSSDDAWVEFKGGMDKAFDELKLAWGELRTGSEKAADKFTH